jgi:hypothetical protein
VASGTERVQKLLVIDFQSYCLPERGLGEGGLASSIILATSIGIGWWCDTLGDLIHEMMFMVLFGFVWIN